MRKRDELTDPRSCLSRAKDDEMTFVLLGRDPVAPAAIRAWVEARILLGKNRRGDPQIVDAERCIAVMEASRRPGAGRCPECGGLLDRNDTREWCTRIDTTGGRDCTFSRERATA